MAPSRYLRSKILAPRLHEHAVGRNRLTRRLTTATAPLWLLSAPAGYGKTTLLLQAAANIDADMAWVSVDAGDNDPIRFWTHVAAAILGPGEALTELLDGLDPDNIQTAVDALLAHVEGRHGRTLLVLDDIHEVHNSDVLDMFVRVSRHPPSNLTLVVATRSDSPLALGRLRASGQVLELRAVDLAFTSAEAAMLFGEALDTATLDSIVTHTEGWPTALRMLAVSTGPTRMVEQLSTSAANDRSHLGEFLANEVLDAQEPLTRDFLIETSIVDDLEPTLCDTLTGRPGGLSLLRRLARSQVFTELIDPAANIYRYHPLFREFLRGRALELDPHRLQALHAAAARWFSDHNEPTPTIIHALAAGDHVLVLSTIKTNYLPYSQRGLLGTVADWLDAYGFQRCRADPELRLAAAWAALNSRRYDDIDQWLDPGRDRRPESADFLVEAHAIRSHRARHLSDLATALTEAERSAAHLRDPHSLSAAVAHAALGMAQYLGGHDATETLTASVNVGGFHSVDSSVVIGYSYLALAACDQPDRTDDADALADQALGFVQGPIQERFHQPAVALLAKSRVALARGLVRDAGDLADRAESIAQSGREPLILVLVHCHQARIAHRLGHYDRARQRLRDAEAAGGAKAGPFLADQIRATRNDTRFVTVDDTLLPPGTIGLTERELVVLRLLPHRLPRKELAAQLYVSENTIKTHLTSIRHKLGVTNRDAIIDRA